MRKKPSWLSVEEKKTELLKKRIFKENMLMKYMTKGVCAKEINFDLVDGKVTNVEFIGGCAGNLKAVGILVEGMPVEEVIAKFKGNICRANTSCTDQFAKALEEITQQN